MPIALYRAAESADRKILHEFSALMPGLVEMGKLPAVYLPTGAAAFGFDTINQTRELFGRVAAPSDRPRKASKRITLSYSVKLKRSIDYVFVHVLCVVHFVDEL